MKRLAICLVVVLASCNVNAGTPYENREACMRDVECSQQFTRYLECKRQYETGCDRYAFNP
jgi:hypothetical protein